MPSRLRLYLLRLFRSIWFLPASYALGSLVVLALAPLFNPLVPRSLTDIFSADALEKILTVIASSMLAVAIFALAAMVSALQAAAGSATPRARTLLTEDRTAQTAISTFIGTFIFSIMGIVGLSTDFYSEQSVACLFIVTILLIANVIIVLITWISRLSEIGSVEQALQLIESATLHAFTEIARDPLWGGRKLNRLPPDGHAITTGKHGFIQHIDGRALGALTQKLEIDLYLSLRPGDLVYPETTALIAGSALDDDAREELCACFVIGTRRTFEADPRFGMLALSEIASRALSPSVNDPGTAIQALNSVERVIYGWHAATLEADPAPEYPRLHVAPLSVDKAISDGFRWIARDGAGHLEVGTRLYKGLISVLRLDPPLLGEVIEELSDYGLRQAEQALLLESDLAMLKKYSEVITRLSRGSPATCPNSA